jgi:hypothetical protein
MNKYIFWSQIDDSIIDFPMSNKPMQEISNQYPVYFVYSGSRCKKVLLPYYPKATFLHCDKNCNITKTKILFDFLKKTCDYDVLIRTCCDAIIFDVDWLLKTLDNEMYQKHAIIGNKVKVLGYIRGGCNALSKSVVDKINISLKDIKSNASFDLFLSGVALSAGAETIHYDLFGCFEESIGKFPVIHPDRTDLKTRLVEFRRLVALAINKKGRQHG